MFNKINLKQKIYTLLVLLLISGFCFTCDTKTSMEPISDNNDAANLFYATWVEKSLHIPQETEMIEQIIEDADVIVNIDYADKIKRISPYYSGINATNYTGNYITDQKLVQNISKISPGFIRFPGGDASNVYFFNGLPNDLPPAALTLDSKWTEFGNGLEILNWRLNTPGFYSFISAVNSEGFITVNYPYARYGLGDDPVATAASLAADWVKYDNGMTKFWEIGNETYACWEGGFRINTNLNQDGQPEYINGQLYGQHFKIFADSMRAAAGRIGVEIYIGAVFADNDFIWDGSNRNITKTWNLQLAAELKRDDGSNYADFITLHSYFLDDNDTEPEEIIDTYIKVEEMQNFIYGKLANAGTAKVPLVLSEWNVARRKQTTHVGAIQAIAVQCKMQELNYGGSCYFAIKDYWRSSDGDFAMFSHADPDFAESEPYPNFYHFYYMNRVMGDEVISNGIESNNDDILVFSSSYSQGGIGIVLINKSFVGHIVDINLSNFTLGDKYYWYELIKEPGIDDWSEKVLVNNITNDRFPKGGPDGNLDEIPARVQNCENGIKLLSKGLSVNYILINGE